MHLKEGITGLTADQVARARAQYGRNRLERKEDHALLASIKRALKEPTFILLVVASGIYFGTAAYAEGTFMVLATLAIFFISLYQESKSNAALEALQAYSQPKATVIREETLLHLPAEDIVLGDYFVVEEGGTIPADGMIERSFDLSVNESLLMGESLPVAKSSTHTDSQLYQGTLVVSGTAICKATAIGNKTQMGRIGKSLQEIKEVESPLQVQINRFVRSMGAVGLVIFLLVWGINFFKAFLFWKSLLKALTLAMSIIPEEIPVAFSTFMALGAWRLSQRGIIVKQANTVETLGSATVICVDKTGTLTTNEMALVRIYDLGADTTYGPEEFDEAKSVISLAMWASEPLPYDPMEKAIHEAYSRVHPLDARTSARMIREYPLGGTPPLMTHVFELADGRRIVAAKGAPEAFLSRCSLSPATSEGINTALNDMTGKGFRVLAVAEATLEGAEFPKTQEQFQFTLKGLVAFYDPPKENIASVLTSFYHAGIAVKLITGDSTRTTQTIAQLVGFKGADQSITGDQLMHVSEAELAKTVQRINIFTRMFPDAKLKVIEALKKQGQVVAMTGDGVNDAPALKAAHIGVAMGSKGSEVARQASALVLADDDLSAMVAAVAMGRKIYSNLKKAIQYIISIHIPIVLLVFLPLVLGWPYPEVFTPVHVIFLELVMGPTCSIVYEREPLERNAMDEKPRAFTRTFFHLHELMTSIVQGLFITAGLVFIYWYAVSHYASPTVLTAMIFVTLITANIFLTLTNRSFHFSMLTTWRYDNALIPLIIIGTFVIVVAMFDIPVIRVFFRFDRLSWRQILVSIATGVLSVVWFECYKWIKRRTMAEESRKT